MINKFLDKWKQEWWLKKASDLAKFYESNEKDLRQKFEIELEILKSRTESLINKLKIEENEIEYRLKKLDERKLELIRADNDLKDQIKTLEAKASPSSVWAEAFSQGMNKAWDLLLPLMTDNFEKLKKKIHDDAVMETVHRMNNDKNKK